MPSEEAVRSEAGGPSEAEEGEFRPGKRLHPLSWLFLSFTYISQFLFPLIIAFFVGTKNDYGMGWVGLAVIFPVILGALWQQFTYRYGFSEKGLVIHEGVFYRNIRTIDYARIENVDTKRGVLHQMLGVAQVQVETSTGGKAEASIRVLGLAAVEEMRTRIFEQRARIRESDGGEDAVAAEPADELLLNLKAGELIRYGLISNRGMVLVAAGAALLAQTGFFESTSVGFMDSLLPWEELPGLGLLTSVLLGLVVISVLFAALRVLSVILALVTFHDFRLSRRGEDLRSQYGLLTRMSLTLRQPRIQAVHQKATLLHRVFKRVSLQADLAGGAAGSDDAGQNAASAGGGAVWLAPLCPREEAGRLIRAALPGASLDHLDWQGLAPGARNRIFRKDVWVWVVLAAGPAVWFAGWWAALILLGPLPWFWLNARLYVKHTGWALQDTFFVFRRGWLTRKIALAPVSRIQSVCVDESPFDRRCQMAKLTMDTAGASGHGHRLKIPYLDRPIAERLALILCKSEIGQISGSGDDLIRDGDE